MGLNCESYAMHMYIRARALDDDEALRAHVERPLRFALIPFEECVGKVTGRAILLLLRRRGNRTGKSIVTETKSPL